MIAAPDPHADAGCSFCRKTRLEVRKLIAGEQVYICDECVVLCNQILVEDAGPVPRAVVHRPGRWREALGVMAIPLVIIGAVLLIGLLTH